VTNSSQPPISTTTLNDLETITISTNDVNTINISSYDYSGTMSDYTYSYSPDVITLSDPTPSITLSGGAPTYTITPLSPQEITILTSNVFQPKEWQDKFPDIKRVLDMCDQYPGLKIAYEKFKHCYEMVKEDYDNPTPKK